MDKIKNDKQFKEAIGAFIIAFSELEFGLVFLCAMTELDIRHDKKYIPKYLGYSLEQKRQHLSDYISENLPELKSIWTKLNTEIGVLNRERRFLAHGFSLYFLPDEKITTHIKEKGKVITEEKTLQDLKKLTNRIQHLKSGKNGITGEFHTLFAKTRIDKWNRLVTEKNRFIFTVNNKIVSEWNGKTYA